MLTDSTSEAFFFSQLDRDIAADSETELVEKQAPKLHIQKWRKCVEIIADATS